jgi:hypothetical protein
MTPDGLGPWQGGAEGAAEFCEQQEQSGLGSGLGPDCGAPCSRDALLEITRCSDGEQAFDAVIMGS